MNITNHAYILWIDGKASKISSDKKCLAVHSNKANDQGLRTEVTHHSDSQEAYDILLSGTSFDEYMNEVTTPNSNRFIKSSFTLSLLWVAKFYSHLAQVTSKPELRVAAFEAMRLMERTLSTFLAKDNDPFHFEFFFPSGRAFLGGHFW